MYPVTRILLLLLMVVSTMGCMPNKYKELLKDFATSSLDEILKPPEQQLLAITGGSLTALGFYTEFPCDVNEADYNLQVWYHDSQQVGFCKKTDNGTWTTVTKNSSCSVIFWDSTCNIRVVNITKASEGWYICQMRKQGTLVKESHFQLNTMSDAKEEACSSEY